MNIKDLMNLAKGVSGSGNLFGRLGELLGDNGFNLSLEPGDFAQTRNGSPLVVSAPLAYDLWYLHNHVNLIEQSDDPVEFVSERLAFLSEKLDGIKPMRGLRSPSELVYSFGQWKNEASYFIQLLAFELMQEGTSISYYSIGPAYTYSYAGYFAFPVGQLGVMEQISLFRETQLESSSFSLTSEEATVIASPTSLFPPRETLGKHCFGEYLIQDAYFTPLQFAAQIEKQALGIPEVDYGKDVKPKGWMRLYVNTTDQFPVPGEFVGILCKPMPLPVHCWWFQESSPFLYSGNWVDTQHLTSGVVVAAAEAEVGSKYKIAVHGIECWAYPSDFKTYSIGDRVAIVKLGSTSAEATRAFSFKDQKEYGEPTEGSAVTDYIIVPLTFYE